MSLLSLSLFFGIIVGTLVITYFSAKKTKSASDFYTAGGGLTAPQNGLAVAGDFMSAASFLGITGAIALVGFDGFYMSAGNLMAFLFLLFLVAEPLRNLGKYTLADMISSRFKSKKIRGMAASSTLVISIFYMIAQLVGAGGLIKLLLGIDYAVSVLLVGALMTIYVIFGGMTATSWVQITKAVLLLGGSFLLTFLVFAKFNFNVGEMIAVVKAGSPLGENFMQAGNQFKNGLDTISFNMSLVFGAAGLPHLLVRFFTVKDALTARKSVVYSTWFIGAFFIMTIFLGFGAVAFVGVDEIMAANRAGNMAAPLLALVVGGDFLFAFISAVAFATILAVVSGLVLTSASAFAHDIYGEIIKDGKMTQRQQVMVARVASIGVAAVSIILALFAQSLNVAFLSVLALGIAASANLPVILLTIYWRRFNVVGAVMGMATGLISSVVLVMLSPSVWNPIAGVGIFHGDPIFPMANPTIFTIPLGFLGAYIGTLIGRRNQNLADDYDEVLFKANTGHGVHSAEDH
ncbi:MAG: sodium/solute symporter [Neisseriaceae bacterium]|nr:sodium/solute symporter [Neisseriaceae bacterium]MBP6861150.1 sodium/solute symporter [Neisseriaceae bacterium]